MGWGVAQGCFDDLDCFGGVDAEAGDDGSVVAGGAVGLFAGLFAGG